MQCALRYFGLIGGVGREKLGALHQVLYHRWGVVVIHSGAGKTFERGVERGELRKRLAQFNLALFLRQRIFALEADLFGHVGVKLVERFHSACFEHLFQILLGVGKVFVCVHYFSQN